MKALTIQNPWAWAVLYAGKIIENRTWRPPEDLLGERLAIHAGKIFAHEALQFLWDKFAVEVPSELPAGVIIGTVRVVGILEQRQRNDFSVLSIRDYRPAFALDHRALGWLVDPPPGKRGYGWVFSDPIALAKPVPCRGAQGVWDVPEDVLSAMGLEATKGTL